MRSKAEHCCHKWLNNRVENTHQPTRRREKILIKFKSPKAAQNTLSLMGKVRNIFAIDVGRYRNKASVKSGALEVAKTIWYQAAQKILAA
jgi:putative transposase